MLKGQKQKSCGREAKEAKLAQSDKEEPKGSPAEGKCQRSVVLDIKMENSSHNW